MVELKTLKATRYLDGGGVGCGLYGRDSNRAYAIVTSSATKSYLMAEPGRVIAPSASESVPGLFTYKGQGSQSLGCVAAVDTSRGQFSVIVDEGFKPAQIEELCSLAVEIVEEFYQK